MLANARTDLFEFKGRSAVHLGSNSGAWNGCACGAYCCGRHPAKFGAFVCHPICDEVHFWELGFFEFWLGFVRFICS